MDNRAPSTVNATMRALAAWLRAPFNLLPALSVRQLLIMVVLFTALPLLALALLVSSTIAATERQANRSALMNNVRTLASLVDTEIDTHLALAAALATSPSLQSGDIAAFKHQAIQALAVLPGAWIHLSDPTGQVVMSTVIPDGAVLPRRNRLAFMQQMWASRQPLLSDVEMSITKQANAVIEVPVFKGGKPLYSIVVGLSPVRFLALLRDGMGRDTVVGLLDRKANFVARIPDHAARVGTPASQDWRDAMARSPEGFATGTSLEGEAFVTPYLKTKHGWTVGLAYFDRVSGAPARQLMWTLGLIGGGLTLTSLAFGFGLADRISSSMRTLMYASRSIANGETVVAHPLAVHEAAEISRNFSVTSEILAARTAELTRANDTFLNLVENAPFGVYLVDSEFCIAQVSRGSANAFMNVQPVLGRKLDDVLRVMWPEPLANGAIARFRHTLETGDPFHQASLEATRLDTGEAEAYDWQIERVTMPDGKLGFVCYYYDLTPLKKAHNELRQSEVALRESEARFRGIFEHSPSGIVIADLDGRIQTANKALAALLGYTATELAEINFAELVHPDDRASNLAEVHRLLRGEIPSATIKNRYLRKDGETVWVTKYIGLLRDDAGNARQLFALIDDVTARKQAEDHQEFLLAELAHRMKNQLAVVMAIAAQTARNTARNASSLKQFQQEFSQRLQGLSVATDVLVAQGWGGAQLGDLVDRQLKPFLPSADRLQCHGPDATVSIDATQAIGLALHELATNASKHGAWSSAAGRVTVTWQFVPNGATGNNLQLTWLEQDGPVVMPPTRKGFGHVVIEGMAAQRVGGTAELVFSPEGVRWTLTMPTAHIVVRA